MNPRERLLFWDAGIEARERHRPSLFLLKHLRLLTLKYLAVWKAGAWRWRGSNQAHHVCLVKGSYDKWQQLYKLISLFFHTWRPINNGPLSDCNPQPANLLLFRLAEEERGSALQQIQYKYVHVCVCAHTRTHKHIAVPGWDVCVEGSGLSGATFPLGL